MSKMTIGAKVLTIYGFALIAVLLGLGIYFDWGYFHSGNILLFAFIIASYPILGIALTILEGVFSNDRGF